MDTLIIEGIHGYNGEYEFDVSYFTNRELHLIKRIAGVRAGEMEEAFSAGDNDLMVALAAICIRRKTGAEPNLDALWDAPSGKFTLNLEAPEEAVSDDDDADVPPPIAPDEPETSDDEPAPDGSSSPNGSDHRASDLRAIGIPG